MDNSIKSQFIVASDKYTGNIEALASRAIRFGKVTEKGDIILDDKSLTKEDIIKLALVLRFIAHTFDESISDALRPSELTDISNQRVEAVGSKLSELATKVGFAKKIGHGQYVVQSYKIDSFLSELESKDDIKQKNDSPIINRKRRKNGNSTKILTGVGRDIQSLIDNNFFNEPKLMNEILQELKREGFFHDAKVIDRTITTTFLKNRRTLRRIKNEDGGKSRWKYLVRK